MGNAIFALADYAVAKELIDPSERRFRVNLICGALCPDGGCPVIEAPASETIDPLLDALCDEAVRTGRIADTSGSRDRFATLLAGLITPSPAFAAAEFARRYAISPVAACDWFYKMCGDVNYIRRARVSRDIRWTSAGPYGELELSINLSKPEKDPRDIAAARLDTGAEKYPKCVLCAENEGYAGSASQEARQNLRIIPITLGSEAWGLQYSPYVYYDEHCIALNMTHKPMAIDGRVFAKLLDFVDLFPHYFIGSNADLPIVGGSILAHEHFQGGRHELPMARAGIGVPVSFPGFDGVSAGIVDWPMSVLRLRGKDRGELERLATKILAAWRGYTDASAFIFAETDGTPHNTVTPVARRRGDDYELDLVLRNNITTPANPLGVFHPHAELHHIKKENIGLIEVMGLAILPARLKTELEAVKDCLLSGGDLAAQPQTQVHAAWVNDILKRKPSLASDAFDDIVRDEIGDVFCRVLTDAGVFKRDEDGMRAFMRFIISAGGRV